MNNKQGLFIIVSSPGGGGKDTVISELLKIIPNSARFITTTSRTPRPSDQEGVAYNFISREDFEKKIKKGYFLEYNDCVGNYYGTPKKHLEEFLKTHDVVFSNIDVNGKHSMDKLSIKNVSFFLLPENIQVLKQRAEKRGGMTAQMIQDRLTLAEEEIEKSKDYDYRITNYEGKLDQTIAKIAEIIRNTLAARDAEGSGVDKK